MDRHPGGDDLIDLVEDLIAESDIGGGELRLEVLSGDHALLATATAAEN